MPRVAGASGLAVARPHCDTATHRSADARDLRPLVRYQVASGVHDAIQKSLDLVNTGLRIRYWEVELLDEPGDGLNPMLW